MPTFLVIPSRARHPRMVDAQVVETETAGAAADLCYRHCIVIACTWFGQNAPDQRDDPDPIGEKRRADDPLP